jgi:hypothetical protein
MAKIVMVQALQHREICFFNNDSYGFENLDGFSLFKLRQP